MVDPDVGRAAMVFGHSLKLVLGWGRICPSHWVLARRLHEALQSERALERDFGPYLRKLDGGFEQGGESKINSHCLLLRSARLQRVAGLLEFDHSFLRDAGRLVDCNVRIRSDAIAQVAIEPLTNRATDLTVTVH